MSNIQIDTTTEKDAVRIVLSAHAGTLNTAIHMFRSICKHNPVATVQLETTVETACELEDNTLPAAEVKVAAGVPTPTAATNDTSADAQSFRDSITEISRRIIADLRIPDFMFRRCKATYIMEDMEECIEYLTEEYKKRPDGKLIVDFAHSVAYDALLILLQRHHAADPIRNIPAFSMAIMNRIVNLLVRKNHDYGNSFGDQLAEDGPIVFKIRMKDKISRLRTLLTTEAQVKDESIEDTLRDIIGYCILFIHHYQTH